MDAEGERTIAGRWGVTQRWADVVMLHYRVEEAEVAAVLPPGLRPDRVDGSAWVSVVALRTLGVTTASGWAFPLVKVPFSQVNVRVYVRGPRDESGVSFLRVLAEGRLGSWMARRLAGLPYVAATLEHPGLGSAPCTLRASPLAGPGSGEFAATIHHLDSSLYTGDPLADREVCWQGAGRGALVRADLVHPPWQLGAATAEVLADGVLAAVGFGSCVGRAPDRVVWSPGLTTWTGASWVERAG